MKKMTLRVDDYVYDKVSVIAKERKTSANKIMVSMIKEVLNGTDYIDYSKELTKKVNLLISVMDSIDKRTKSHFRLSKQHFANRGFLSNADIREDKMLNEMFKNNFYD